MFRFTMQVLGTRELDFAIQGLLRKLDDWTELWPKIAELFRKLEMLQFQGQGRGPTGKWVPLSPKYAAWKARHHGVLPILVLTGALRESLTMANAEGAILDTTKDTFRIGTGVKYARFHQAPDVEGRPPRRKVVDFSDAQNLLFAKEFQKYVNTDALKSFGAAQRSMPMGSGV